MNETKPKRKNLELGLTPLQHRFVLEYIKDQNISKAAERAGAKGTKETFRTIGARLIRVPEVQKAIEMATEESIKRAMVTRDTLICDIQSTILEARRNKKYDAAFKGYAQLGEILGLMGSGKKLTKKEEDELEKQKAADPSNAFGNGSSGEINDLNDDISTFLKLVSTNKNK